MLISNRVSLIIPDTKTLDQEEFSTISGKDLESVQITHVIRSSAFVLNHFAGARTSHKSLANGTRTDVTEITDRFHRPKYAFLELFVVE